MKSSATLLLIGSFLTLSACMSAEGKEAVESAKVAPLEITEAVLKNAGGTVLGKAILEETESGLRLTVNGQGLTPGAHGTHIHTVGRCDAPDFASAGGHWNPTSHEHGRENPKGPHAGDLPNLLIGTDGQGSFSINIPGAKLRGDHGVLDADGASLIVHSGPDDMKTDPSGNSGGRIACGVFAAG